MKQRDFLDARILLVDDEQEKIDMLSDLLRIYGYRNMRGQNVPTKVADTFIDFWPDLVILDLKMPGFDGFQVLQVLGSLVPDGEYLPIIVQTGDTSREARERALMAGALDFVSKPFNTAEILLRVRNLLHTRALHLELMAERESLEDRVVQRTHELQSAQNEMLERLAMAAEFRDDQTGDHIRRVGRLSREIALEMGMPWSEADLIGRAALLHDIGKIGVRDEILLKKGRFTPEEFIEMKRHTELGASLLAGSTSKLLQMAERIALSHHERWDGTGYIGMSGEGIPLESRIVAVADVYDALISERPYKLAWPKSKAIEEVRVLAGTHFDPNVVRAFDRVMSARILQEAA